MTKIMAVNMMMLKFESKGYKALNDRLMRTYQKSEYKRSSRLKRLLSDLIDTVCF